MAMDITEKDITTVHFRKKVLSRLPENCGVYVFWCKTAKGSTKYIYVGMTARQSLRKRLIQHWKGSHNPRLVQWINVSSQCLRVTTIPLPQEKIVPTEKRLICTFVPDANDPHKCPEDANEDEIALIGKLIRHTAIHKEEHKCPLQ